MILGKAFHLTVRPFEYACAGQGCQDRDRCLRYLRPAAELAQKWFSADIERKMKGGPCPAIEEPTRGLAASIRKALQ